jgi:hypothetical protein
MRRKCKKAKRQEGNMRRHFAIIIDERGKILSPDFSIPSKNFAHWSNRIKIAVNIRCLEVFTC